MYKVKVEELPLTGQNLVYLWDSLRLATEFHPTFNDFTPVDLKECISMLDIFDVEDLGDDFKIRVAGNSIKKLTGENGLGKTAKQIDKKFNTTLYEDMKKVYLSQEPALHKINILQKPAQKMHRVMLPIFSMKNIGEVDHIFIALFKLD